MTLRDRHLRICSVALEEFEWSKVVNTSVMNNFGHHAPFELVSILELLFQCFFRVCSKCQSLNDALILIKTASAHNDQAASLAMGQRYERFARVLATWANFECVRLIKR